MIKIQNLSTQFSLKSKNLFKKNILKAVEKVNLIIPKNSVMGLVGESGCGKSTLGRSILRLIEPSEGEVYFYDNDILKFTNKEMSKIKKKLQIVFQDPYSSLNPRMTIFEILKEGLDIHYNYSKAESIDKSMDIITRVNLKKDILQRYPHEFSGGQRQRISIARSLILNPEFLVCDEVTSALDVSNQAQIINLLNEFKKELKLSILFISHDLNIISYFSDYIAVMYLGKILEVGTKSDIINNSTHPYTRALFSSIFDISKRGQKVNLLKGEIPGSINKPTGCYFHTRCPYAKERCSHEVPIETKISGTQSTYCHYPLNSK